MKNMNTTLEIPEGSKATIQGKVINGKNYLVVEVENEEQKEPEWTKFKKGDFVVLDESWISIYKGRGTSETCISDYCGCWIKSEYYNILGVHDGLDYRDVDRSIRLATEEEKQDLLDMLAKKGLMWDAEKLELVKIPDVPEWTKFKRGDVLVDRECWGNKFVLFDEYVGGSNRSCFNCIYNNMDKTYGGLSKRFCKATDKEKAEYFEWLRDEEGLEWDGEKLVEVLKEGDLAIFWDDDKHHRAMIGVYELFQCDYHIVHMGSFWDNAIKWDGTKEQYEKVLRGELK